MPKIVGGKKSTKYHEPDNLIAKGVDGWSKMNQIRKDQQ